MLRFIFKLFTTAFVAAIGFGLGVHYGTNEKVAKIEGAVEERLASAISAVEAKMKVGKAAGSAAEAVCSADFWSCSGSATATSAACCTGSAAA